MEPHLVFVTLQYASKSSLSNHEVAVVIGQRDGLAPCLVRPILDTAHLQGFFVCAIVYLVYKDKASVPVSMSSPVPQHSAFPTHPQSSLDAIGGTVSVRVYASAFSSLLPYSSLWMHLPNDRLSPSQPSLYSTAGPLPTLPHWLLRPSCARFSMFLTLTSAI